MERPGWYLVAYDIADPRRLRKIHYRIKKEGLAVQQSVFFVNGRETEVKALLDKLQAEMDTAEDDLRAYPVTSPREVWTTGGPLAQFPLATAPHKPKSNPNQPPRKNSGGDAPAPWWRRMFGGS